MKNTKKAKRKLVRKEMTRVIMDCMMGLDENMKLMVHQKIKRTVKKLADGYESIVDKQHRAMLKQLAKEQKKQPVKADVTNMHSNTALSYKAS